MEVILLERIEKLGQMGQVVSVKAGFARNFLLPKGKALRATDENKKMFETKRVQLEAENLKRREEAQAVANKMGDLKVVLVRQAGDAGQLYGSVSARDIADAVTAAGFSVGRSQVELANPIKTIGLHKVRVRLHGEVSVLVTANVARSADEAETQEKTGAAVLSLAQQDQMEAEAEKRAAEQADIMFDEGAEPEEETSEEGDAEKA